MKKIHVKYYAALREKADKNVETIEADVNTAKELYMLLKKKYDFSFCCSDLKVAINTEFSSFDAVITNEDTVVFIPPVAGG